MVRLTDKEILLLIELGCSASPAQLRNLSPYEAFLMREMLLGMGIDLRPLHHKIVFFLVGVLTLGAAFFFSFFSKPVPTHQELLDRLEIDKEKLERRRENFKFIQPFLVVLWVGILATSIIVISFSLFGQKETREPTLEQKMPQKPSTAQAMHLLPEQPQETPVQIPGNHETIRRYESNMREIERFSKSGMLEKTSRIDTSCGIGKTVSKEVAYFSGKLLAYRKTIEENHTKSVQSVFYSWVDEKPFVYVTSFFEFGQERNSQTLLISLEGEAYPVGPENNVATERLPFSPVPLGFMDPERDFHKDDCQEVEPAETEQKGTTTSHTSFGTFPLSHISWGATLTGISGTDTAEAMAIGKVTVEDAMEYCRRDPGGESHGNISHEFLQTCSQEVLDVEQGRMHKSTADCEKGLVFVDHIGTFQKTESLDGQSIEWVDVQTGESLIGMASGEATVSAHHEILCPLTH